MVIKIILVFIFSLLAFGNITCESKDNHHVWESADHPVLRLGATFLLAVILYPLIFD